MSRRPEEISGEALAALRRELRRLPAPEASSDFGARVHAELNASEPARIALLWAAVRPALSAAALSLVVTLALLKGLSLATARGADPGAGAVIAYGNPASAGAAGIWNDLSTLPGR